MDYKNITTLGDLKKSGYTSKSIRDEVRNNLIEKLSSGEQVFEGILGFDHTVIPDIQRALLSSHNILLLGLRGQAKTKIARLLTQLLDEKIPIISGSELNDDPMNPLSRYGRDLVAEKGDETPIEWIAQEDRYVEKLATPDVSIADLIGDVDPIKAATLKLPYSDERVIHFGLVPRSNKAIFVINELPDLQPRIQVSLFNILQEGDIQIRGFKLRMPLDILFVFTANPEDYTNRGSIITPLKDRIESQILTHYPTDIGIAQSITQQEAHLAKAQKEIVKVPEDAKELLERMVFAARESEYIDEKSGISARMSISAYQNLISSAERRSLINKEKSTQIRLTDFWGVIPAITGKAELVYEGEQEGPYNVAIYLIQDAIEEIFDKIFPHPDKVIDTGSNPYEVLSLWFNTGKSVHLGADDSDEEYQKKLNAIPGLKNIVKEFVGETDFPYFYMELILNGLATKEQLNFAINNQQIEFNDLLSQNFGNLDQDLFN